VPEGVTLTGGFDLIGRWGSGGGGRNEWCISMRHLTMLAWAQYVELLSLGTL